MLININSIVTDKATIDVEDAIEHDAHHEVRKRGKAIELLHLGHQVAKIAESFGFPRQPVTTG
jgi:hypothetical protein